MIVEWLLWVVVGALLVGFIWLQFRGVKALKDLGVPQASWIVGLKIMNVVLIAVVVVWVLWEWVI